jgi:hypothetical protein
VTTHYPEVFHVWCQGREDRSDAMA